MIWSAVCSAADQLVTVLMYGDGSVHFSDGATAAFGATTSQLAAAAQLDRIIAAAQVGDANVLHIVDNKGHHCDLGVVAFGVNCIFVRALAQQWEVTWTSDAHYWQRVTLSLDLVPVSAITTYGIPLADGTTQGLLGLDANGMPIWTDATLNDPAFAIGGLRAALWSAADGYVVFQERGPRDGIVVLKPEGTLWLVFVGHTEHPCRVAAAGGTAVVAIDGRALFIADSQWQPYVPPASTVPTFPKTSVAIPVGVFGEPHAPHLLLRLDEPVDPDTVAAFVTLHVSDPAAGDAAATLQAWRDKAAAASVPLLCYLDRPGLDLDDADIRRGVDIPAVFGYLSNDTPAQTAARVRNEVLALRARGHTHIAIVAPAYCGVRGDGTFVHGEQETIDVLLALWNVACATGCGLWCFAYDRGNGLDGLTRWPSLQECINRMRAASGQWDSFPFVGDDMPLNKPEVTVQSWTLDQLRDGREFVFEDRENPDLGYVARVWIENGFMYASLTNKAGTGRTFAKRQVVS